MAKYSKEFLEGKSYEERYALLTKTEKRYFNMMKAISGVLFLTSEPGKAKSSIGRNIAHIMGYGYKDVRLATADETDFGLPKVKDVEIDGKVFDVHTMTVPEWAIKANQRPTIIHFEELNRCSLQVRNACLGVLLERILGTEFKFNDNVLLMASGDLGEMDGTDVDEFDRALNNRLIHAKHELDAKQWIDDFANDNIHPLIVNFVNSNPDYYYRVTGKSNGDSEKAFPTPRTWHFLSDYILSTLGNKEEQMKGNYDAEAILELLRDGAVCYIGSASTKLINYIEETIRVSIDDVIDNFNKVKDIITVDFKRAKRSELLHQLSKRNLTSLKGKQITNIISFLNILDEDEKAGYLTSIIDDVMEAELKGAYNDIIRAFPELMKKVGNLS